MKLSVAEQIMHSTIRIETIHTNKTSSVGTGFIFSFCVKEKSHMTFLITNKHVIENAENIYLTFTLANENFEPIYGNKFQLEIPEKALNFLKIEHPNHSVDLVALSLSCALNELKQKGIEVFYQSMSLDMVPTEKEWESLDAIEEVTMIGYPGALWDKNNNLPLFRRGITATHPAFNLNGKKEFLVDIACFGGSSGSPIFLFNEKSYFDKSLKAITIGGRLKLLGIQYAGPTLNQLGDIVQVPKTFLDIKSVTPLFMNLAYAIKSTELWEIENILRRSYYR